MMIYVTLYRKEWNHVPNIVFLRERESERERKRTLIHFFQLFHLHSL